MKKIVRRCVALLSLALAAHAFAANKPAEPYANPHLAASTYPAIHAGSASRFSPIAGPAGPSRRLGEKDIIWVKTGPIAGWGGPGPFSGPYPSGKRVMWVGGYDRVAKLDADTLEVLTTHAIGGNTFYGDVEIERHIATVDKLDLMGRVDYMLKHWKKTFGSAGSCYHMLSRQNEFYMPFRAADGTLSLRVYGEADASDPASEISLRREWKIPTEVARANPKSGGFLSVAMTSDGWVVMATQDGTLIALSQDFKNYQTLKLPRKAEESEERSFFDSFVRNGANTDDRGGIYIVTRDYMHRVQWTGQKLSLDEADGGWSVTYPNGLGIGSGTTPSLMGWGSNEDHLVAIADATPGNNLMVLWRDEIPADWKGLPGFDRRVAGVTPVKFGDTTDGTIQIENTPVIYGYGAFLNMQYAFPVKPRLPNVGNPGLQWLAENYSAYAPGHESRGGAMIRWDPKTRALNTVWTTQTNFVGTVCSVSGGSEMVYCWGARNGEWTLEATDWNTGKSAFHYTLGKSQRFDPIGGNINIAPDGSILCGCAGGLGVVKVPARGHGKRG